MKNSLTFAAAVLLCACSEGARQPADSFTIKGRVNLPDGYVAGLVIHTDTAYSVSICEDADISNGQFTMTGQVDKPYQGTLMTNNLRLVEQNQWPTDSIRWTYSEVFLSNGLLLFTLNDPSGPEPKGQLTGTQVQTDYHEWLAESNGSADGHPAWAFIDSHPESVVSVWLANQLTDRAYHLTAEQTAHLEQAIKQCPADTARFNLFKRKLEATKKTVKNAPLVDLELTDVEGTVCRMNDVVPRHGKYVLIDFWASWCGICIHSMPDIAQLANDYQDVFEVIGVSIDTKPEAWHKAMQKHPEPWPQYCTTQTGYQDLFDKYQVGNGVPYYLLLSPEGRVLLSPEGPDEVREFLEETKNTKQ